MKWEPTCADGAGTTTKMVPTDDGGHILATYGQSMEVFSHGEVETLPPHRSTNHAIDLEPSNNLQYGGIYSLSEFKLRTLKAYIEANLANEFIQRSSSLAAAPILCAKIRDGELRLCVDYRALNLATVTNQYPLPRISEMLDCGQEARRMTKRDLRGAYNPIRTTEGDEYKKVFQMPYCQFEYWVMPFGLTITHAMFQSYMGDYVQPYVDDFAVCSLAGILMYSTNDTEHEEHVCQVRQHHREFGLYCKAERGQFRLSEVGFLGLVITVDGVSMELDRITTMEDWPAPKSVRDVQVLHEFTNIYQRFIRKYAKVTLPLTELLYKSETARATKWEVSAKCEVTQEAELAFRRLNRTFTEAPILQHCDRAKPILVQPDPSGFPIAGILNE